MTDRTKLIFSATCLAFGAMVYVLFREPVFFTQLIADHEFRLPLVELPHGLMATVVRNYLPDALWCVALMSYASTVSAMRLRLVAAALPFLSEFSQLWSVVPGTFDWLDLAVYFIIIISFIALWKRKTQNLRRLAIV